MFPSTLSPSFALDCSLVFGKIHDNSDKLTTPSIPAELRAIIGVYFRFSPLNNESIREAVFKWKTDKAMAILKYGHISYWDVSQVTDMSNLFAYQHDFDEDIGQWDVSQVTTMTCMFHEAYNFNHPLNQWNVSNVTNMRQMFSYCVNFNQPLDNWQINPQITNMQCMFYKAEMFNQCLDSWEVNSNCRIEMMFHKALRYTFNNDLRKIL